MLHQHLIWNVSSILVPVSIPLWSSGGGVPSTDALRHALQSGSQAQTRSRSRQCCMFSTCAFAPCATWRSARWSPSQFGLLQARALRAQVRDTALLGFPVKFQCFAPHRKDLSPHLCPVVAQVHSVVTPKPRSSSVALPGVQLGFGQRCTYMHVYDLGCTDINSLWARILLTSKVLELL